MTLLNKRFLLCSKMKTTLAFIVCVSSAGIDFGNGFEFENYEGDGVPLDFSQALVVEKLGCQLTALDINSEKRTLQLLTTKETSKTCFFDFFINNTIYYNFNFSLIHSSSSNYPDINLPANYLPEKTQIFKYVYVLSVDFITKKLYAISTFDQFELNKLIVVDLQNNNYGIILSDLNSPTDLVLDPEVGLMFISQLSTILRANMDGSSMEKIVEKDGITELAIDRRAKRIYWTNLVSIESSDYAGRDRRVITSTTNRIKNLAVLDNRLFWLLPPHGTVIKTTIWSCSLSEAGTCGAPRQIPFDEPLLLRTYDFEEMQSTLASKSNPCESDNGGCEQLCLLTNDTKGYSCACTLGYSLAANSRSCSLVNELLLYIQGNAYVKGRVLDPTWARPNETMTPFVDVIYPNRITPEKLKKGVVNFDYDFGGNFLYFNDEIIYEKKLISQWPQAWIDSLSENGGDVSTDWMSGNLYSVDGKYGNVRVCNYPLGEFLEYAYLYSFEKYIYPRSIAVHPKLGHVYFSAYNGSSEKSQIYRMNTDGTQCQIFKQDLHVQNFQISIDHIEDRLYWFSADGTQLQSIKLDGSSNTITSIDVSIVKSPRTVNVYRDWAYVSNLTSIWRLHKATGAQATQLIGSTDPENLQKIAGAMIFSREAQPIIAGHPCAISNGGCEKFCYAISLASGGYRRVCGCTKEKKLQIDGKTCI